MFEDDLWRGMKRLQKEINNSFNYFWGGDVNLEGDDYSIRSPLIDLEEEDGDLVVKFEIPGINKDDIKLNVDEDKIEVRVEKKKDIKKNKKDYYREERDYRGFYRVIKLPTRIDSKKVKAKYTNGILEVRAPKIDNKDKNIINVE